MRETLLHLAASVLEDLQRRFCNFLVIHFQTAQQRLKSLSGVKGHWVSEGQHLRGRGKGHNVE